METSMPGPNKPRRRGTDDSRAERKRIQDRLAQRATRERTKNRIAYLEQRLSSLEAGDKHGEITQLTRVIDNLRNDNHRLRNALVKMRTVIDQAVLETDDQNDDQPTTKSCGCEAGSTCVCPQARFCDPSCAVFQDPAAAFRHNSVSSVETAEPADLPPGSNPGLTAGADLSEEIQSDALQELFDFSPHTLLEMFEFGPPTGYNGWQAQAPSPFDYRFPAAESTVKVAPDVDKWEVSNGAFISCLDCVKKKTASNLTLDMHVPFKAVIWGWDNVGPDAQHPVWAALRQVDQRVFGTWTSKAQRIALMYVCQTLIQYREDPTKENLDRVPVFLRPRPSQERVQHPAVIDFLIWYLFSTSHLCTHADPCRPGLRDRLVFEHKKYTSTGDFSAAFVENFNFHWPYSDRDIFAYNPTHNRYEVSKIFVEHAYNFKVSRCYLRFWPQWRQICTDGYRTGP
jgi:hypothetical protein